MAKKKTVVKKPEGVKLVEGNGLRIQIALLDKIARKLDNIDANIVAQNDMFMEALEKLNDG